MQTRRPRECRVIRRGAPVGPGERGTPARRGMVLVLLSALMLSAWLIPQARAAGKVLLIIADDLGADSLAMLNSDPGSRQPPTPTLDSLRSRGVLFRNCHSHPTCSPARASMLTGRYPFRHGIGYAIAGETDPVLRATEQTIPRVLSAAGSAGPRHAAFGKWHLGGSATAPNDVGGWGHFSGSIAGALPSYDHWPKVVDGSTEPNHSVYATTDVVDDAAAWIRERGTAPWLAWVAFNAGHVPLHKPPGELHSYDGLPSGPAGPITNPRPYFEAMIEAMDTEIGRLLRAVDLNETTVVFVGDNGTAGGTIQAPYVADRAKGTLYEGGLRVPLLVAGAGVTHPGRESAELVHLTDLFATLLELAGADLASAPLTGVRVDARSLLPILRDEPFRPSLPAILSENFDDGLPAEVAGRAVIEDRFKLIQFATGAFELYDLLADPLEATNLLATAPVASETAAALNRLKGRLANWVEPPRLSSPGLAEGRFEVRVTPVTGIVFQLQRGAAGAPTGWATLSDATRRVDHGLEVLGDPAPVSDHAVYRVVATVP